MKKIKKNLNIKTSNNSPLILSLLKYLVKEESKKNLFSLDDSYITNEFLKGYLLKEKDIYYFIDDNDYSIQLIFNPNFFSEYIKKLPDKTLEKKLIILKKFRYDFLVYEKEKKILFNLICFIEEFEIDFSLKKEINFNPINVNLIKEIKEKSQLLFNSIIKELLSKETLNLNFFTASNFINNNYINKKNNKDLNLFNLLIKSLNIKVKGNNFLLKEKKEVLNKFYLYDDIDNQINYVLKNINWKEIFYSMPSINNIKKGLNSEKLITMVNKRTYEDLIKNELKLNIEINGNSIKEFLEKKTKRMNKNSVKKFNSKVPSSILDLMKNYGDVMANVGNSEIEKMKRYNINSRKEISFSNKY